MKSWLIVALTLILAVSISATASGQINLPKGLEGVLPIYPGAEVVLSQDWDGGSQTFIETRDEMKAVVIFFRKALAYQGWSIVNKIALENRITIVFSKADLLMQLTARDVDENQTRVIVSIAD